MFGILLIALVAGIIYKAAEIENRNGTLWAALSILITLVWGMFLPFGFAAGLVGTFVIMFICNMISGPRPT